MSWKNLDEFITRVIRVTGLVGVCWEAIMEHVDRPYLFFMFASMMGLAKWSDISTIFSREEKGGRD